MLASTYENSFKDEPFKLIKNSLLLNFQSNIFNNHGRKEVVSNGTVIKKFGQTSDIIILILNSLQDFLVEFLKQFLVESEIHVFTVFGEKVFFEPEELSELLVVSVMSDQTKNFVS